MARVPRTALPDGWFHVWARGVAWCTPFPDGEHRDVMVGFLRTCVRRFRIRCDASTVMSTHFHFVGCARVDVLSRGMHWLNGCYARWYNRRHDTFGHVFAERFQCRAIEDETSVFDRCEYVVNNPVKAGLCERAEDWSWSWSRYW